MNIKTVLFDLDGTLLPMDQEQFTKAYFELLAKKLGTLGYEPKRLVEAVWKGTAAMVCNNGEKTNEDAFWKVFAGIMGENVIKDKLVFEEFYRNEFQKASAACGYNPKAAETVDFCKKCGYRVALATNPIFPAVATESRIRWAGLRPEEFEFYTTYENSRYCKPNPDYYRDIISALDCDPRECLMVGNDVSEDMVAKSVGMNVFLLTDCMINKDNRDISQYQNGSFSRLCERLAAMKQGCGEK